MNIDKMILKNKNIRRFMFRYPLMMFGCTLSLVCAQEIIQLDKIDVEESFAPLEERREHSIAKRIVDASELAQYGDMNLMEMLKRTPGVTIPDGRRQKGPPGKGYTKVLIDGEDLSSGMKRGGNPLEQITPEMVERFEIMTNGSAEHSAEAMGGIVNVILKNPASDGRVTAKLSTGFYDDVPVATLFTQYEGKNGPLSYMLNATYSDNRASDLQDKQTDRLGVSEITDESVASRNRNLNFTSKIFYVPDSTSKYTANIMANTGKDVKNTKRIRSENGILNQSVADQDESTRKMIGMRLSGEHRFGQNTMLNWKTISHQNIGEGTKESYESVSDRETLQEDDMTFRIVGGDTSLSYFAGDHFFKTGIEYKQLRHRDEVKRIQNGVDVTLPSDNVAMKEEKTAVYLQDEFSIGERMVITPGIRYENVQRDYGETQELDYVAPSIHFLYRFTTDDTLRASVAKTVRLPKMYELSSSVNRSLDQNDLNNPDTAGNSNLTEESALSYELRFEHFFEDKGIISISSFYREIDDKIEQLTRLEEVAPGVNRYVKRPDNVGEGKLIGLELEVKKSLTDWVNGLRVWGNMTVQDTSLKNTATNFKGVVGETPDYLFNIGIDHTLSDWRLTYGAAYRYNGGFDDPMNQSEMKLTQEGYGVMDFYVNKRFNDTFRAGFNVKNVSTETIKTASKRYLNGILQEHQIENEYTQPQILVTLEGRW
jgi:outer membrane receptor for ferrienterochelin and colicins